MQNISCKNCVHCTVVRGVAVRCNVSGEFLPKKTCEFFEQEEEETFTIKVDEIREVIDLRLADCCEAR